MLDVVLTQIRGVVKGWEKEVEQLRRVSPVNPVADTTAYRASELASVLDQLEKDTELLTTAQYAKLHKRSTQTVTTWIRTGRIRAVPGPRGTYLIERSQIAPMGRRATSRRKVRAQ